VWFWLSCICFSVLLLLLEVDAIVLNFVVV
jgi:hypothetical protein